MIGKGDVETPDDDDLQERYQHIWQKRRPYANRLAAHLPPIYLRRSVHLPSHFAFSRKMFLALGVTVRLHRAMRSACVAVGVGRYVTRDAHWNIQQGETTPGQSHPFILDRIRSLTLLKPGDLFVDVGHGEGVAAITLAATTGCSALGVEIVPSRHRNCLSVMREFLARVRRNRLLATACGEQFSETGDYPASTASPIGDSQLESDIESDEDLSGGVEEEENDDDGLEADSLAFTSQLSSAPARPTGFWEGDDSGHSISDALLSQEISSLLGVCDGSSVEAGDTSFSTVARRIQWDPKHFIGGDFQLGLCCLSSAAAILGHTISTRVSQALSNETLVHEENCTNARASDVMFTRLRTSAPSYTKYFRVRLTTLVEFLKKQGGARDSGKHKLRALPRLIQGHHSIAEFFHGSTTVSKDFLCTSSLIASFPVLQFPLPAPSPGIRQPAPPQSFIAPSKTTSSAILSNRDSGGTSGASESTHALSHTSLHLPPVSTPRDSLPPLYPTHSFAPYSCDKPGVWLKRLRPSSSLWRGRGKVLCPKSTALGRYFAEPRVDAGKTPWREVASLGAWANLLCAGGGEMECAKNYVGVGPPTPLDFALPYANDKKSGIVLLEEGRMISSSSSSADIPPSSSLSQPPLLRSTPLPSPVSGQGLIPLHKRLQLRAGDFFRTLADPAFPHLNQTRVVYCCNYENKWESGGFQSKVSRLLARCLPRGSLLVTLSPFLSGKRNSAYTKEERTAREGDLQILEGPLAGDYAAPPGGWEGVIPVLPQLIDRSLSLTPGKTAQSFFHTCLFVEVSGGWPTVEDGGGSGAWDTADLEGRMRMLESDRWDSMVTNTWLRGRLTPQYASVRFIINARGKGTS